MNVYRIVGNDLKRYIKRDDNCLYPIQISNGSHMYKLKRFATGLSSVGSTLRLETSWLSFR